MHKNLSHLPITIRLLLHHQIVPIPRKSPKSKSKPVQLSILSGKMSTSSNSTSTPPQLSLSDLTTPGSSSSSSSNLAIPAAAVEELVNPSQKATIEQSPPEPSPRYADVCYILSFTTFPHSPRCLLRFFFVLIYCHLQKLNVRIHNFCYDRLE